MTTRTSLAVFVVVASLPLAGCLGPALASLACPPRTVRLDVNDTGTNATPLSKLSVGETRAFGATVQRANATCDYAGLPVRHIEWSDLRDNAPTVQIRLQSCATCTLLFDDGRGSRFGEPIQGSALVNGDGGARVILEVKGMAPGPGKLRLTACTDDNCWLAASDTALLEVE